MSEKEKIDNLIKKETLEELKKLKRENRRQTAMLLIAALQIGSLIAFYYLGRSSKESCL